MAPILWRFLIGGLLLFTARLGWRLWAWDGEAVRTIDAAERDVIVRRAFAEGSAPRPAEEAEAWAQAAVDEEILRREAERRGLAATDPVVQRRRAQTRAFVENGDTELPAAIDDGDAIIRRRLAQRLRAQLESDAAIAAPSPAEIAARHAAAPERWRLPATLRFTQIFFSRDHHGDAVATVAATQRDRILAAGLSPPELTGVGDALLFANDPGRAWSRPELAAAFGEEFADAALAAPMGSWSAPIASPLGLHLIWTYERRAPVELALTAAHDVLRREIEAERRVLAARGEIAALRRRYLLPPPH